MSPTYPGLGIGESRSPRLTIYCPGCRARSRAGATAPGNGARDDGTDPSLLIELPPCAVSGRAAPKGHQRRDTAVLHVVSSSPEYD
eukprot:2505120-Alexandrium_andersonii.AAC.1